MAESQHLAVRVEHPALELAQGRDGWRLRLPSDLRPGNRRVVFTGTDVDSGEGAYCLGGSRQSGWSSEQIAGAAGSQA